MLIEKYCLLSYWLEKFHRDTRDWFYCWIIPFGDWTGDELQLKYNNIKVCTNEVQLNLNVNKNHIIKFWLQLQVKRGDICVINSKYAWHALEKTKGKKQSLVFTNHWGIVHRYIAGRIDIGKF